MQEREVGVEVPPIMPQILTGECQRGMPKSGDGFDSLHLTS